MITENSVYEKLTIIFHDVFMRDDIVLASHLTAKDIEGWDSFKQIDIIMASEEQFGVTMSTQEIEGLKSVGELANLIIKKSSK